SLPRKRTGVAHGSASSAICCLKVKICIKSGTIAPSTRALPARRAMEADSTPSRRPVTDSSPPSGNGKFYFRSLIVAASVAITMLWATPRSTPSSDSSTYAIVRSQARSVGGYYSPAHRNDTTVVSIDDDSLDPQKGAWPVPYRTHARWSRNIGSIHKPRAIFLDITFGRERDDPTLPESVSASCESRDAGVPVFSAASPGDDGGSRSRAGSATPAGQPPCFTSVDVCYSASQVDRSVWSYPLWSDGATPSAASAMTQDVAGIASPKGEEAMASTWAGTGHSLSSSEESTPPGNRDADPAFWMSRSDVSRSINQPVAFDEVAIDYCVTYERPPPSWEPSACSIKQQDDAVSAHAGPSSHVSEVTTSFVESQVQHEVEFSQIA
ncbi:hypothetical protein OY671_007863, partial [Metschnikowia pulcherrima]